MGLLEKSPPLREGINMRSPGLGVPPEATNPVVQVIHRNEKDIRRSCGTGQRGEKPERKREENKWLKEIIIKEREERGCGLWFVVYRCQVKSKSSP